MISLLAFGSYIYQSASAIILIFAVSHILSPAQYTSFSLALATSQLFCVFVFEWLQLAGVRFLAAASGEEAARLRFSLFSAGLLSALVLLLVGGVAYTVGAVFYALRRPNPWPTVFGHHEFFHACTVVAALCHHIGVYFAVFA
jgi:predicted membrane channel-forming protein YqfA (hemolysin III family)